ncbi:MAG TPA: ABC transporter ATP-binding protein [Anaerolineales bacterium]|nr:ABC transporter ATP-binding protein [Anaerolineales bacterium]
MDEPILSVSGVSKHFGGLMAVNDVSFSLPRGQIMGLMGPNGAGKTTLVNIICGYYKPDSGMIKFKGIDITNLPAHKVCGLGIARTYQIPQPFGELTVQQNTLVAAMYGRGISQAAARGEVAEALEITDLANKANLLAKDMSTIALKRLELARALATGPSLLLVDEAAAGLNESELPRMLEILENIRQTGVTILLIEHIMKVMREAVDTILVMDEGSTIASGSPEEVMKDKRVIECYLGEYA